MTTTPKGIQNSPIFDCVLYVLEWFKMYKQQENMHNTHTRKHAQHTQSSKATQEKHINVGKTMIKHLIIYGDLGGLILF